VERLLYELGHQRTSPPAPSLEVICLGAKWEMDTLAALSMVTHGLAKRGDAQTQVVDTAAP
jgi:hypothetical protein